MGLTVEVLDADPGQQADAQPVGDHRVRTVVVHVDLGQLHVTGDQDRLPDRLQVGLDRRNVEQLPGPRPHQVDRLVPERGLLDQGCVPVVRPYAPRAPGTLRDRLDGAPVRRLQRALEQMEQALAARVHDVGLAQDRQQRRRLGDGPLRGLHGGREHGLHVVIALRSRDGGGTRLPDDREDRSLDRLRDRLVGLLRARVQRMGEVQPVEPALARQAVRHALQDLADDDARVAARPHQRAEACRLGDALSIRSGPNPVGLVQGGPDGREHVRPGVSVRHREDVEGVDLLDVRLERGDGAPERCEEARSVAGSAGHQATSVPLSARSSGRGSPACVGPSAGATPCSWRSLPIRIETRSGCRPRAWSSE